MPYLDKAETWLEKSSQLLEARPSTTRITTKYTLLKPSSSAPRKSKPSSKATTTDDSLAPTAASLPDPVRATLVLKTFDPVSGATLKYTTNKAAEVSRLIQILGKLGRPMASLPEEAKEDVAMVETPIEGASGVATPVVEVSALAAGGKQPGQGGGGPKKGKKKGKR